MDSSPVVVTAGSSALSEVLTTIAAEITTDLNELRTLFRDEFVPRAKRIGDALNRAKGNFGNNADFYDWAAEAVGIKERQVRTYLRFANKLPAIEAAMEETDTKISSMEQGLALLTPPKEEEERTEKEMAVARVAQTTGRAIGGLTAAIEAIADLAPGGLTTSEVDQFQRTCDILRRWGTIEDTPEKVLAVDCPPVETTTASDPEWSDEAVTTESPSVGDPLPLDKPVGEWNLHQLERGLAQYDTLQKLADAMAPNPKTGKPFTKAAVSARLKKLRNAAGIGEDADSPALSAEATVAEAVTEAIAA